LVWLSNTLDYTFLMPLLVPLLILVVMLLVIFKLIICGMFALVIFLLIGYISYNPNMHILMMILWLLAMLAIVQNKKSFLMLLVLHMLNVLLICCILIFRAPVLPLWMVLSIFWLSLTISPIIHGLYLWPIKPPLRLTLLTFL